MNSPVAARSYAFESVRFDAPAHELHAAGRTIRLRPQASLALALLLSHQGEVVTKDELRAALWPDSRVVMFEGSIAAVIRELRRALGDNPKAPRFIETIPKRGYRFIPQCVETAQAERQPDRAVGGRTTVGGFARVFGALGVAVTLATAIVVLLPGGRERALQSSAVAEAELVTVAVLPFEDLTQLPAHRLLSQTIARDLVGWLGPAASDRLRVVDNADAGSKDPSPADFLLRGSVRDDAGAAVVSARLLTAADGGFVWGEDYRRSGADPGLASREVAARIAEQVLSSAVPPSRGGSAMAAPHAAAADAYQLGMKGFALLSEEGTAEAVTAFEQATLVAPEFADAHARLAEALIRWPGPPVTPDRVGRARRAAGRAIELVPDNAVAHRVLGEIHLFFDRDWQLAGSRLERSVQLSPADASGHQSYAGWLSARGRHGEALREIDLAEALDPASIAISIDAMLMRFYARDFEGTIGAARRLAQLWPESASSHRYILLSRLIAGDVPGAAATARSTLATLIRTAEDRESVTALADAEALDAYWTATLRGISRYVREESGDPTVLALVHVQMGQLEVAVGALELATSEPRFSYFLPYLGVSPAFDRLCGHPKFERMLRRLGQSALGGEPVPSRCESVIHAAAGGSDAG